MFLIPYVVHLLIGLAVCFVGTIPFGPINLTVVKTTLKKGLPAAIQVSFAAAIVEIFQAFLALYAGMLVIESIEMYPMIKLLLYGGFFTAGAILFFRKTESEVKPKKIRLKVSNFTKGIVVALLNLQAVPFWVFFQTYMKMSHWIDYELRHLAAFFIGVFIGKFLALYSFALLSVAVSKRLNSISLLMNKILGSVLMGIGFFQIFKYFWWR